MRFQSSAFHGMRHIAVAVLFAATTANATDLEPSRLRLNEQLQRLVAEGFRNLGDQSITLLPKGEPILIELDLVARSTYAFVAACGESCRHVELSLIKGPSETIATSSETAAVAMLAGQPPDAGDYKLRITTPVCDRSAGCSVSFAVLERPSPSAPAPTSTLPSSIALVEPAAPENPSAARPVPPGVAAATAEAPTTGQPQPGSADQLAETVIQQLKSMIMTQIEIDRARTTEPPALIPATATVSGSAPGKAKGAVAPSNTQSTQQVPPPPQRPAGPATSGVNCQAMYQRYLATAKASGSPESIAPLTQMYQRFQAQCPNFRP